MLLSVLCPYSALVFLGFLLKSSHLRGFAQSVLSMCVIEALFQNLLWPALEKCFKTCSYNKVFYYVFLSTPSRSEMSIVWPIFFFKHCSQVIE